MTTEEIIEELNREWNPTNICAATERLRLLQDTNTFLVYQLETIKKIVDRSMHNANLDILDG